MKYGAIQRIAPYLFLLKIIKKDSYRSNCLCTPSGTRTLDPLIKSQLLYQLS